MAPARSIRLEVSRGEEAERSDHALVEASDVAVELVADRGGARREHLADVGVALVERLGDLAAAVG